MIKTLKTFAKQTLLKIPFIKRMHIENRQFKSNSIYPAGHYYSTIIDVEAIKKREEEIWGSEKVDGILGVDLNVKTQLEVLKSFEEFYDELPFKAEKQDHLRFAYQNGFYSYSDAISLYSMIRKHKPNRIIEAGSGHSSALMLDVNNLFFNDKIKLTFIEPYPERLNTLISEKDKASVSVIKDFVQFVDLSHFEALEKGDILFIDSTHVSKTGSDVNFILFDILPHLKPGVLIHFHDIFYPFEYPKKWVFQGRNWNEDYILRAFLSYNSNFEILFFSHYLHKHHKEAFKNLPLMYKNFGGNLWMVKK